MLKNLIHRFSRFFSFTAVGAVNSLVDFSVYTALTTTGLRPGLCQAAGYCAGMVMSFILNRGVTFRRGTTTTLGRQIPRFLAVNAVSLVVSTLLVELLTGPAGLHQIIAKIPVIAVTALVNYFGYKLFVFAVKGEKTDDRQRAD